MDEFGTRVNSADSEIPDEVRERFGGRLIMYGSTQTHSLGVKVSPTSPRSLRYAFGIELIIVSGLVVAVEDRLHEFWVSSGEPFRPIARTTTP